MKLGLARRLHVVGQVVADHAAVAAVFARKVLAQLLARVEERHVAGVAAQPPRRARFMTRYGMITWFQQKLMALRSFISTAILCMR